jgi:tetratricopeptide (TPR) repeat protein
MDRRASIVVAVALAVVAITVWVHAPCLKNQFLDWDDDEYLAQIARHPGLTLETFRWAFTTVVPFYYQPLAWLSHAVDVELWGRQPWGHHLTSLGLHGLNTALVFLFVWMLGAGLASWKWKARLAAAAGVALVFGIHPLQVESVAWVAERKNVLCGFFFLAGLCAYLRHARPGQPPRGSWWWASMALGVAALLSKPMAMSLAAVMLALDFFPLRRQQTLGWGRLLREKSVLIAACAADAAITFFAQAKSEAVSSLHDLGMAERCLVAARGIIFYLWKLLWPAWLSPYYPGGGTASIFQAEYGVPAMLVALICGVCLWRWKRTPALLAAWMAFLALIVPVSGLFQAGEQAVADRFMYLAMVPPLLLAAGACVELWRRFGTPAGAALVLALGAELSFFGVRSREQIPLWHDQEVFWQSIVARFPQSGVANLHDARVLAGEGRFEEGLPRALQAAAVMPEDPRALAVAGLFYLKTHDYDHAVTTLQQTLELDPTLTGARYNLACAYCRLRRLGEAFEALRQLLAQDPRYAPLAARDAELNDLRQSPDYGPQLRVLLRPP